MAIPDILTRQIAAELTQQLGDAAVAEALARIIGEDTLSWRAPEIAPRQVSTILAFTFGNRMHPNGNREPGPVNAALADIAVRLQQETGAPVYAQWEIAAAIGERLEQQKLIAIYPGRDERAEPVYLSTSGVVSETVQKAGDPASLGRVGIVAVADHAWRCVTTARRFGLDAAMPAGYAMPAEYDPLSGQPWCRSRLAYLLHDMAIRLTERRGALIAEEPASGIHR